MTNPGPAPEPGHNRPRPDLQSAGRQRADNGRWTERNGAANSMRCRHGIVGGHGRLCGCRPRRRLRPERRHGEHTWSRSSRNHRGPQRRGITDKEWCKEGSQGPETGRTSSLNCGNASVPGVRRRRGTVRARVELDTPPRPDLPTASPGEPLRPAGQADAGPAGRGWPCPAAASASRGWARPGTTPPSRTPLTTPGPKAGRRAGGRATVRR